MTEWTSLSVKEATRDRFNDAKESFNESQDDALPDLGTDQFLKMLLDTLEHTQNGGYNDNSDSINMDELEDRIVCRIAREQSDDFQQFEKDVQKTLELAEQARDNTEEIKTGLGR